MLREAKSAIRSAIKKTLESETSSYESPCETIATQHRTFSPWYWNSLRIYHPVLTWIMRSRSLPGLNDLIVNNFGFASFRSVCYRTMSLYSLECDKGLISCRSRAVLQFIALAAAAKGQNSRPNWDFTDCSLFLYGESNPAVARS